ncbi:glycosyl hydrolase [Deinococcus cellulosilyticus]|uniref:Mannan endo-1,4-beta-mannosidase n=1 Tax=Deinococcus cellulosilyticus (strain DSM 18568 / NBRC 106333 / KACC 11606 / 5516J-15) TaxID=1223518 RepID=A0A511MV24_DEIC1|nr:glycosyl hydrolase [Deinococcus cellulosilyticus]GEM44443.1 hypothetical protein DC3_00780 [Deinococcus cellulosilyticus NBRC 106333 = KACC 11606]
MKHPWIALLVPLCLAACSTTTSPEATMPQALVPGQSSVLDYIKSISGKYTISGQHNREPNSDPTRWTRYIQSTTGKTPGLWGGDFLFMQSDINYRQTMINEAKNQYRNGAVVALTWHMCPPTVAEPCNWDSNGVLAKLSDTQWNQLITNGTALNNAWKARLDKIVPFLQDLKNNNVQALFRPIHEMNDAWSWWGGRPGVNGSRKLYQITYDYLVKTKGFNNLIWVWNVKDVGMDRLADYWPGADYVDVASVDMWYKDFPTSTEYNQMLAIAGSKPIALAEVGKVPTSAQLASQPRWAWFMTWAEYAQTVNTPASLTAVHQAANVLTRDEMNIAYGRPATASSVQSGYPASNVTDGNLSTRWSSAASNNQSLTIDLGSARTFNNVQLAWEAAYGRAYQIQVSNDGVSWWTVYNTTTGDGGTDSVSFTATTGRYIKLQLVTRGTSYGFSLWDVSVFNK